ncbi:MAG: hypothetical protein K0R84_732 [Clostridia bacterium]|nr:hypothetical protein [Clostridia bacterium]
MFSRARLILLTAVILIIAIVLALLYFSSINLHTAKLVMGATLISQSYEAELEDKVTLKPDLEKYFRPSKLPILNDRVIGHEMFVYFSPGDPVDTTKIKVPKEYQKTPEEALIYYFSILREAENLVPNKTGGCGTVGSAKGPFPLAYNFLTPEYQEKVSFDQYLRSFEGIGHTNLIKLRKLPPDKLHPKDTRYFVELETIEGSDKGLTYFAYYFGFVYLQQQEDRYLISDMALSGEDFLCAAYHGWSHNAEWSVDIRYGEWCKMIKEKYPLKHEDYVTQVSFKGTDGNDYMIEFMQLTNDTDFEVAQYKKAKGGMWQVIYLNPEDCLKKR